MKTIFVGNIENEWLMHGAIHHAYEHIPDLDVVKCYTPHDVNQWAGTLGKFVQNLNEEYFLLMLDDYWIQDVDALALAMSECYMKGDVQKIDLSGDRLQFPHQPLPTTQFVKADQSARYRTSLQAAIWKRDYLLNFCVQGWTPWDFEIQGDLLACNDGATILGTNKPCIRYINVLRKGKWYGKFDF